MPTFRGTTSRRIVIDLRSSKAVSKTQQRLQRELGIRGSQGFFTEKMLRDLARKLEVFYIKPMLAELREAPSRRTYPKDYPIEFVSDVQRRYVMWLLGGKPYRRKNQIINAWGYKTRIRANGSISFEVFNDAPHMKYVVGLIGMGKSRRSIKRYTKHIQPFHQKTGWKPAYEIVQQYIGEAQEDAVATVKEWLSF